MRVRLCGGRRLAFGPGGPIPEPIILHASRVARFPRRAPGLLLSGFTNGQLITDKIARQLRHLANVTPLISIEGTEVAGDERRGKQRVLSRTLRGLDNCLDNKLLTGVATSLCQTNIDDLLTEKWLRSLIDRGVQYAWYHTYRPVGPKIHPELALRPDQARAVREFVVRMRAKLPIALLDAYYERPDLVKELALKHGAKDTTIRGTATPELESMTPRGSQYLRGEAIPEKHWMYRLAKKFFFYDFGAYAKLDAKLGANGGRDRRRQRSRSRPAGKRRIEQQASRAHNAPSILKQHLCRKTHSAHSAAQQPNVVDTTGQCLIVFRRRSKLGYHAMKDQMTTVQHLRDRLKNFQRGSGKDPG
ncbi:MAG: radical SAM protein [Verrucomicrobia bacterium]|nr:radical SAM protein [Verrucomicrobiota bacterium]